MREENQESRTLKFIPRLSEATVRRFISISRGLVGVLFVLGLVTVLPGVDRLLSALSVRPTALFVAVATLLVIGALVLIAPVVRKAVEQMLAGPDAVVEHAAESAMYLVGFIAVVIVYRGFAGAVTRLFEAFDIGGLYHLSFLVLGLFVLGALARRLYLCWLPVTDLLTSYVTDTLDEPRSAISTDE